MLWGCIPGTLSGLLLQICSFRVFTLLGLKMGVGGPGQTNRSRCTHFDLEFTGLHVCLSVCKALFWDLEHPLPPTLAAGRMNAAAELQHRPPDASASQLTCAFQLLGCLCRSISPRHGRHGSSESEEGALAVTLLGFHSRLEIGA